MQQRQPVEQAAVLYNTRARHQIKRIAGNQTAMNRILLLTAALCCSVAAADKPRVLIIGDSISLGYTPHVVRMLKDEALVQHNRGNAQHTGTGLKKIDNWLGDTQWDVIHFNWGLWDLCYRHPESKVQGRRDKVRGTLTTTPEQYEKNLDQLVSRMKQTQAVLIWASTTVVPEGEAGRRVNDDRKYNEIAARVMQKHGVRTNDLNSLTRTFAPELFTKPGDVHFKPEGYQKLAEQVATSIRSAVSASAEKSIDRILFGSCIKQQHPVPIFDTIVKDQPDLFIFLGDNIYGDTQDMTVLQEKYGKLAAIPGFRRLKQTCPVLATWDDHDYGVNDGGRDFEKREESRKIFLDFWRRDQPSVEPHEGVYDAAVYGPAGRRVQIILLDTRYFRSPLKRGEKRVGGSWVPDHDPSKTMLGEGQWKWLKAQLLLPADLRIIASSIQFVADDAGQETWSNLPVERQRMLDLLKETKAGGVVFISGDRHWSELSSLENELSYPLFDLTSSSLNQIHPRGTPTKNSHRHLEQTVHTPNYGVIQIDWKTEGASVKLQIRDDTGKARLEKTINVR